ncbi:MAM domain-containing protein 2-like [Brachionichthys hirsutus]|uniref:MAM domain-containing protein 2-like n=1 Tax=Brachionichthys hirsutus TaxID=412623 RepID=UPI0036044A4D
MLLLLFALPLAASIPARNRPLPGSCDFESNTCGYTSEADFTGWTLHNDGRFIAVDAATNDGPADGPDAQRETRGVLLSPALEQAEWSCLRLVHQITGSGRLEVLQRTEGKSLDRPLWSSRTPSDSWVISSMDLQNNTDPYQVVIEGKPGPSAGSSVAIFEIHISSGYCLECDFEDTHLCGYSNQWNANVNWYVGGGGGGGGGGGFHALHNNIPNDHTYSNKTGHLMYVDSIHGKAFKEEAKLVSPMTTVAMSGCLSFQYQRSEDRGNLFSVYTRDRLGQYQDLWQAGTEVQNDWSGTPGEWMPVQVDLKAPYPVQVVFEVAFNSPSGGRVAVDDISFSPEFCSTNTALTFDPSIANCNFEAGLCQYTQDQATGMSWRRVSVKPNIFRNGDHTTGAGSFLLADSHQSPQPAYMNRLIGPVLLGNTKFCLRFYFSLRGFNQTDRALSVYLQQQQGSSQEKIWDLGEKSRGIWIATDVTFQTTQPAKVVFVSVCRSIWDCGSVALDDVSVILGDCELTAGSFPSLPGHCDFEAGLCGYTQDHTDGADWERRRGPTPTSYTGPRGDHTTGLGHYLHMEASTMLPGQNARLLSRLLRGSRAPQCLRFFYHMYGSGTGQLSVHLDKDGEHVLLWQRSTEQSIAWLRAAVRYKCDSQHRIVFEATRGSSVRSDIAIDDIMLDSGPCPETETEANEGTANDIE